MAYEGRLLRFAGDGNDWILDVIRKTGTFYERDVLEYLRERMARGRGGLAVDVGAFVGTHSTYFALFCNVDAVEAFEAHPVTFRYLRTNMRLNGLERRVRCHRKAVGAREGRGEIVCPERENTGANFVRFDGAANDGPAQVGDAAVEVVTLDGMFPPGETPSVRLIKMDVEGAEQDVIRGAMRVICDHRPVLCIEAHTAARLREILSLLDAADYMVMDCLGMTPTYVLESPPSVARLRRLVNRLWIWWAMAPARFRPLLWPVKQAARWLRDRAARCRCGDEGR